MAPKKCIEENRPKRKAVRTTIENKKEIIARWESGTRVADLAIQFGMPRTTISSIVKNKDAIKAADVAKGIKILASKRWQTLEDMEKLLLVWITEQQMAGVSVSESIICEKAKRLHDDLRRNTPGTSCDFMASRGWFDKFAKRTGIHNVARHRETSSYLHHHHSSAKAAQESDPDVQDVPLQIKQEPDSEDTNDNEAMSLTQPDEIKQEQDYENQENVDAPPISGCEEIKQEQDYQTSCGVTSTDTEDSNINVTHCDRLKQEITEWGETYEEKEEVEEQRRLFTDQESPLEDDEVKDVTNKELKEGIAMLEKCTTFWEMVDPNFERSSKVNMCLENSIACYKKLLRERKKTSMLQTSLLSFKKQLS